VTLSLAPLPLATLCWTLGVVIVGCGSGNGSGSSEMQSVAGAAGQMPGAGSPLAGTAGTAAVSAGTAGSSGGAAPGESGGSAPVIQGGASGGSAAVGGTAGIALSAGAAGEAGSGGANDATVPGIIAVGYGGLRVVSRDLGKTWSDETHWSTDGGDDKDLLRTIAYGNGVWVSAGWRLITSTDGVSWSDHGMADDVITPINCAVTDGMAFGDGRFLVACGSNLASSSDGLSWTKVGPTPNVGGHPYLLWDASEKQFVCSGDEGPSFVSPDGKAWTKISISKAHLCDSGLEPRSECASFYTEGVFLTTEWGGAIRRSTNGTSFTKTYQDQFENNLFTEYSFGVGRVAP
jgi:hypothetical protein